MFIAWGLSLLFLYGYYVYFQIPLQRSFIHAVGLLEGEDYLKAMVEFDGIIRIYPYYIPAYVNRWYIETREKKFKAAQEDYQRMYGLYLKNGERRTARGYFYFYLGRKEPAAQVIAFYDREVQSRYLTCLLGLK